MNALSENDKHVEYEYVGKITYAFFTKGRGYTLLIRNINNTILKYNDSIKFEINNKLYLYTVRGFDVISTLTDPPYVISMGILIGDPGTSLKRHKVIDYIIKSKCYLSIKIFKKITTEFEDEYPNLIKGN